MRILLFIPFFFCITALSGQTLGGNTAFNFLRLSHTPQLTAAGGVNVSLTAPDAGLAFYNPALLKPAMHSQLNTVFNSFYSGVKTYHASLGYHHPKLNTNFLWGLHYFDYGNLQQTDAAGNITGIFSPRDFVMQVSASRSYLEKWNYGAAIKYIHSGYGQYRSSGIAVDAGLHYYDSAKLFSASIAAKNMGFQLKKYTPGATEELPFDLIAGITKRLDKAPFAFSITAQHLHQFDIRYNDTVFNADQGTTTEPGKKFTLDKLFRHFVAAVHIYPGDKINVTIGYNHLRRKELTIGKAGNGLNGFSMGVGVTLKKIQVHIARSQYQNNTGYSQFGLNIQLNQYFGLGKWGERNGW